MNPLLLSAISKLQHGWPKTPCTGLQPLMCEGEHGRLRVPIFFDKIESANNELCALDGEAGCVVYAHDDQLTLKFKCNDIPNYVTVNSAHMVFYWSREPFVVPGVAYHLPEPLPA